MLMFSDHQKSQGELGKMLATEREQLNELRKQQDFVE